MGRSRMKRRISSIGIITASILLAILLIISLRPADLGLAFSCKNGEFKGFHQSKEPLLVSATAECTGRVQVYVNDKLICDNTAATGKATLNINCKNLIDKTGERADIYYKLESPYGEIQEIKENVLINA